MENVGTKEINLYSVGSYGVHWLNGAGSFSEDIWGFLVVNDAVVSAITGGLTGVTGSGYTGVTIPAGMLIPTPEATGITLASGVIICLKRNL